MNSSVDIVILKNVCEKLENATVVQFLELIAKGKTMTAFVKIPSINSNVNASGAEKKLTLNLNTSVFAESVVTIMCLSLTSFWDLEFLNLFAPAN